MSAPAVEGGPLAATGHPLQRAGAWAVAVLAGREHPREVSSGDLDAVAGQLVREISLAAVAGKESAAYEWWKVLFALFPNSKATHSKRSGDRTVLEPQIEAMFAPDDGTGALPERPCTYCGAPSSVVWTKSTLAMFDTNKALNTLPPGVPGWPVCRGCRIAAWALPYGAWVTAGSATVLSCEEEAVERAFAERNVRRARRIALAGFGALRPGGRAERVVLAALRAQRVESPAASTLWSFKNDNQEPWLRVTRARRAVPLFLATVDGNEPLRRGWHILEAALTRRDQEGAVIASGADETARLLFEAEDGRSRTLLFQLHQLLQDPKRAWSLSQREALTRLAFDYAERVLGMEPDLEAVAVLVADWIEHGSGSPRGRLAEYRNVVLSDYGLGQLLIRAHFRLTLDGRPVATGPEGWKPLIARRPRAWESRMLLAARVLQLLQERGVVVGERSADEDVEETVQEEPGFGQYDDDDDEWGGGVMAYLAGKMVLAIEAGAPNNGRGEETKAKVKFARVRGRVHPYISAQAARRWVRDGMVELGSSASPVQRVGKPQGKAQKANTAANPAKYPDDDLFGYMRAGAKKDDAATTLRDSPFMLGTLMSVEPARPTEDFGVMARGVVEPVLHGHEFYTADLAAPFLLDVPRIGTFTMPDSNGAGRPNYLSQEQALQVAEAVKTGAKAVEFRSLPAVRLPIAERRARAALLLESLAHLSGGAKQALHYGDRVPSLIVLVPFKGGINPLANFIDGVEGSGLRVRGEVLRAELEAWDGEWEAPVRVGWRPGFRDDLREAFAKTCQSEIDAGQIVIDHPRTVLRTLADELRGGGLDGWFDDPER
ncbi:type I-B CRISPR-associated protein Cas7/Cst2/DevR [Streptomyces daliensis]